MVKIVMLQNALITFWAYKLRVLLHTSQIKKNRRLFFLIQYDDKHRLRLLSVFRALWSSFEDVRNVEMKLFRGNEDLIYSGISNG